MIFLNDTELFWKGVDGDWIDAIASYASVGTLKCIIDCFSFFRRWTISKLFQISFVFYFFWDNLHPLNNQIPAGNLSYQKTCGEDAAAWFLGLFIFWKIIFAWTCITVAVAHVSCLVLFFNFENDVLICLGSHCLSVFEKHVHASFCLQMSDFLFFASAGSHLFKGWNRISLWCSVSLRLSKIFFSYLNAWSLLFSGMFWPDGTSRTKTQTPMRTVLQFSFSFILQPIKNFYF